MDLRSFIHKTTEKFIPLSSQARLDSEQLVQKVLHFSRPEIYKNLYRELSEKEFLELEKLVERYLSGEPLAYIVNEKFFYKDSFFVQKGVLIPRPETEGLVLLALEHSENTSLIFDFGCGSGCVGLSLLKELPKTKLVAVDTSPLAISCSQKNAQLLGFTERVEFLEQKVEDLDLKTSPQLIVANPPYIPTNAPLQDSVKNFEPAEALYGGEDGLDFVLSWSEKAFEILSEKGVFIMETDISHISKAQKYLQEFFKSVIICKDCYERDRFLICLK